MRRADSTRLPASADSAGHSGQVGQQREQRVVPVHPARPRGSGRRAPVPGRGLEVVDHGVGDHPHPVPGGVHPPAEVDVVTQQRHGRVEAADLIPHIPADQHPGAAHGQHVAVPVVLALVDLAWLDAGDPAPGPVDGDPGLEQHVRRSAQSMTFGPSTAADARLGRAAQQLLQRVRGGLAVVVQQPDPLGPLARGQPGRPGTWVLAARCRSALATAAPYPVPRSMPNTTARPSSLGEHGAAAVAAAGIHGRPPAAPAGSGSAAPPRHAAATRRRRGRRSPR